METTVELITPEIAAQMLMMNVGNRNLRKNHVTKLAREIERGDWIVTHQGIAIAPDGRLLDGQHRLAAIIMSKLPTYMSVSRNADPKSFIVLDQGAKRTISDALGRSSTTVSALRWAVGFSRSGAPEGNIRATSVTEVAEAAQWFGPHIDRVTASCAVVHKTRTAGTMLFPVALRVAMGQAEQVLPMWRAFVLLDLPNIQPAVASLLKRLDNGTVSLRAGATNAIIYAFNAFDPARQQTPLGGIRNAELSISEIRDEIAKVLDRWTAPK